MDIPLVNLACQLKPIREEIEDAVRKVYDTCSFLRGPAVMDFQTAAANYLGICHAIGCGTGSDALYIALLSLGIGPGDEVITVPNTYIATPEAIRRTGASIVFCDIEPNGFTMNPAKVKALISQKTKAILPVHIYGQCAQVEMIKRVAGDIPIIEDAAQAWGASRYGAKAGSLGNIGCFSFYPTKPLGAHGDGGMVVTNDDRLSEIMLSISRHGESKVRYYNDRNGLNSSLDSVQAATLGVKLKYVDAWNKGRAEVVQYYTERFAGSPIGVTKVLSGNIHVWHHFIILVERVNDLIEHLNKKGIECGRYYPLPQHLQTCYREIGHQVGDFLATERVCNMGLSIPCWPEMTQAQRKQVADEVLAFCC